MIGLLKTLNERSNFSDTEKIIAKYVIENYREVVNCSTRQLAKKTFTSSAAIVRFSQKLGFEGYTDFKTKFLAEMMQHINEPKENFIKDKDTINMIVDKVTSIELNSIKETREKINPAQFVRATNYLKSAQHIDFYAMNNNLNIARMASESFIVASKYSTVHTTMTMQYLQSLNTPKDHIAFIISRTGENRMLIDVAKMLSKNETTMILITTNQNSTLSSMSKVVFPVASNDKMEELGPRVFLTGAKYVIDVLFALLMVQVDYVDAKRKEDWLKKSFYY